MAVTPLVISNLLSNILSLSSHRHFSFWKSSDLGNARQKRCVMCCIFLLSGFMARSLQLHEINLPPERIPDRTLIHALADDPVHLPCFLSSLPDVMLFSAFPGRTVSADQNGIRRFPAALFSSMFFRKARIITGKGISPVPVIPGKTRKVSALSESHS